MRLEPNPSCEYCNGTGSEPDLDPDPLFPVKRCRCTYVLYRDAMVRRAIEEKSKAKQESPEPSEY